MTVNITRAKFILREKEMPMFSDDELKDYLSKASSEEEALYELLLLKSENTSVSLSGLTTADTSDYFKRLAAVYRPSNSGILGG